MKALLDRIKREWLCWRDGKQGCDYCKHNVNNHDWWGCALNFRRKK